MKIARYAHRDGRVRLGLVEDGHVVDLDAPDDMPALLSRLPELPARRPGGTPLDEVRLLAPLPRPPKFLAIGLNYADHVREAGMQAPPFPVFFNKQTTCVVGPGDPVHRPRVSALLDYEGELGIVIGRRCRHVPAARAMEVIAGYLVVNDVTIRDWQMRAPTMTIGKSFDTHGPLGPWIVTRDEIPDPQSLQIRTFVNEQQVQDTNTREMIFDCARQIETLTTAFTLEPGDVIATGTGPGVGFARTPPLWLRPGDRVRVEIEKIGTLENPIVDEPEDSACGLLPPAGQ